MADTSLQTALEPQSAFVMVRRLLADYVRDHWPLYVSAFLLMGIGAGATALSAYLVGHVVNASYVNHDFSAILGLGLFALVVFIVKGLAVYGQAVMMARVGNRIVADNQRRLFERVLQQKLSFFADRHSSEFAARLTIGAYAATQVINLLITAIGRDFLSLVGLGAVMVTQDPILSLITLFVALPAFLVLRRLVRRIRNVGMTQYTRGTQTLETMQEALQGIRIVKAFTLEGILRERFDANVARVEQETNKMARIANRASPLMEMLGGVAVAAVMIYGGYRVIETGATPGEFVSFLTAFLLASEPAKRLARFNIDLNSGLVGVRVLFEIVDAPATEPPEPDKPLLHVSAARVEFARVQFQYREGEPVLRDLSFIAEPGQVTALVGSSGAGKSTALNLLLRLYEPTGGRILIDGQDVVEVSRDSLRHQIGYVGQETFLFRGTIRDNIAFGKPNSTDAEIVAAAKAAHAHDFVTALPAGYQAPVGEHGLQLSGGQRQRIAIARALIKNAPIILLDEATAALDSESERHVQDALAELCRGRTTIVIAHRLSTIMHADRILVIEKGSVAESGRHEELLRRGGRYASFYRLQLAEQHEPAPLAAVGP